MHGRQAIEGAHMLSRLIYDAITMEPQSNESTNRCSLATQKISWMKKMGRYELTSILTDQELYNECVFHGWLYFSINKTRHK